ncbi:MAG: hypothetical protein WDZ94_01675 [Patescibacteria group bacterium]
MSKQRVIVTDDHVLIDMDLIFAAIEQADGDWEKVEKDMAAYLNLVKAMVEDVDRQKTATERMIVSDDQLLVDMQLLFKAIRETEGDWEKVREDMEAYLDSVTQLVVAAN